MPQSITDNSSSDNPESRLAAWRRRALIIWSLVGVAAIAYVLGIMMNVLAIPLGILIWTVIIVFLLRWQVEALAKRGMSRLAATSLAYVGFIAGLAIIGGFLFSPVFRVGEQFQSLISGAPAYFEQAMAWINEMYARYSDIAQNPTVATVIDDLQSSLTEFVRNFASSSIENLFQAGSITANMIICFLFGLIVAFWLLLEMPGLEREMHRLTAGKHSEDFHFFHVTMSRAVGGYIHATLLQCGIIAIACMIAFTIAQVPNQVALALLVGLVNVVPVVGPWIAAIIVFFSLIFTNAVTALVALVLLVIIQRVVYVFISPKLMGDAVDVHPALVIIAMMIGYAVGIQIAGLMGSLVGMLLSIPLAAIAKATFVYYFEKRTGRHLVAEDGVLFKGTPAADGRVHPARDAVARPRPSVKAMQEKKQQKHKRQGSGLLRNATQANTSQNLGTSAQRNAGAQYRSRTQMTSRDSRRK